MTWPKGSKQVRFNEPLSRHTTLRIGGGADIWAHPSGLVQLKKIISCCSEKDIPYLIIGSGSNILFSDKGFKGAVICLNSSGFNKVEINGQQISCGAGLALNKLIRMMQFKGLGGLEFLSGIPASVGGAVVMNAGSQNKSIGALVKQVTVMDKQGRVRVLNKRELKFGYRRSNLNKYVLLEAILQLVKMSPQTIEKNIASFLAEKKRVQDLSARSAGCIFKNPQHRLPAGKLIEACGLKGRRSGGAEISTTHANYIINRNQAKAKDVLDLMRLAQCQVKEKFDVRLEPEIKIIK